MAHCNAASVLAPGFGEAENPELAAWQMSNIDMRNVYEYAIDAMRLCGRHPKTAVKEDSIYKTANSKFTD